MTDVPSASPSGERDSLWLLTSAPAMWAAHFLLSYVTAAVWCGKVAGPAGALNGVHVAIAAYTVVALTGITFVGWVGLRRHGTGAGTLTDDRDSPDDQRRFLGLATLLLAGLSAVAVLFVGFASTVFTTCR